MMKTRSTTALASFALVCGLCFLAPACAQSLDARCSEGACDARDGAAGADADGSAPIDPCVDTPTDPKCLDEAVALFVSAAGDDKDPLAGTKGKPFKTIGAAVSKVDGTKRRIYVCVGTYAEAVTVKTSLSILGGLACDWVGTAPNPRIVPAKGVALSVLKTSGVAVISVDVEGVAEKQVSGDSAIAVFVSESKGVLFRRVGMKAGPGSDGTAGADGESVPNYEVGAVATTGPSTATTAAPPAPVCVTCMDGSFSTGGKGAATLGSAPLRGTAMPAVGGDNSGGTVGGVCSPGTEGAGGVAAPAAAGADRPGVLTAAGWRAASAAKKGVNGNPGQGGGGGGSNAVQGGGSGGCGGCGGTGGSAGTSGGSSFALLTFESEVTVETSTLTTSKGGIGGPGGKGQKGQLRGGNGNGACIGGPGGQGAGGGGGGGGAGGHSAPIAHSGKAPTPKDTTMKPAGAGDPGPGGALGGGSGAQGAAGSPGAKASSVEILAL